ncbi:MAG: hypothetical protein ACLQNV_22495 [Steroidobacteraceae bacterium]
MPIITKRLDYNGFLTKVERLGLTPLVQEAEATLTNFDLRIEERRHINGTRGLRREIDKYFESAGGWTKINSGSIDWQKSSGIGARLGVEVQVSGRSDMLAVDIMHLKEEINHGRIDVGLIVVPDDTLSRFLTDRTPNLATAIKYVQDKARDMPIRIVAFGHNGVGPALDKMRTNLGKVL